MRAQQAKKFLKQITVMHLQPGDIVFVRLREQDREEHAAAVVELLQRTPGVSVVFLRPGQSVSVARPPSGHPAEPQNGPG